MSAPGSVHAVTGAFGFSGRHIASRLLAADTSGAWDPAGPAGIETERSRLVLVATQVLGGNG